jgi:hypothetical protein
MGDERGNTPRSPSTSCNLFHIELEWLLLKMTLMFPIPVFTHPSTKFLPFSLFSLYSFQVMNF